MAMTLKKLYQDERGVIISAELVLVLTIVVLGVIVGLSEVAKAINTELNDISNAIGALDQSFGFTGFHSWKGKAIAFTSGTTFIDTPDDCDFNTSCDIVCGVAKRRTAEGFGGGWGGGGW
jgi:Flp pilus assembly pilin Flp